MTKHRGRPSITAIVIFLGERVLKLDLPTRFATLPSYSGHVLTIAAHRLPTLPGDLPPLLWIHRSQATLLGDWRSLSLHLGLK